MRNKLMFLVMGVFVLAVVGFLGVEYTEAPDVIIDQNNTKTNMLNSFSLTSPAFEDGGLIPALYTCDGDNVPPPLVVAGVPEGTSSLVLVMDDSDIPDEIKEARGIEKFDHWSLYNIPPDTTKINNQEDFTAGENGIGEKHYTGPCPPSQYKPTEHRYIFRLYALSGTLNFIKTPTLDEIESVAIGMMLAKTELTGRYSRTPQ